MADDITRGVGKYFGLTVASERLWQFGREVQEEEMSLIAVKELGTVITANGRIDKEIDQGLLMHLRHLVH